VTIVVREQSRESSYFEAPPEPRGVEPRLYYIQYRSTALKTSTQAAGANHLGASEQQYLVFPTKEQLTQMKLEHDAALQNKVPYMDGEEEFEAAYQD
jgi:hypothetical protein